VAEKVYRRSGRGYQLVAIVPVPHRLQDYTAGYLRIRATDSDGRPSSEFFETSESHYIVHVGHLLSSSPCKGGPMRSLLFWTLFSIMDRDWWVRFLDKYGSPFLVGKHEAGDDNGRSMLLQAIHGASKLLGVVVTKDIELNAESIANTSSMAEAFKVFADYARTEQSKLIVGQTLSSTPTATGLGSSVADLQSEVRDDIRRFDAMALSETIRDQIARQILEVNGLGSAPLPNIGWRSLDDRETRATVATVKDLAGAGYILTDQGLTTLSERTGLPLTRGAPAGIPPFFGEPR